MKWGMQDEWEAFVADNWSILLEQAFGACWRHHFANDVTAILHLTMQQSCLADPTLFSNWAKSALPVKLTMTPTSSDPHQTGGPSPTALSTHSGHPPSTHSDHPLGTHSTHSEPPLEGASSDGGAAADCNGNLPTPTSQSDPAAEPAPVMSSKGPSEISSQEANVHAPGKRKAAADNAADAAGGSRGLTSPPQSGLDQPAASGSQSGSQPESEPAAQSGSPEIVDPSADDMDGSAMGLTGNNIIHPLDQAVSSLQQLGEAAGIPISQTPTHSMYMQGAMHPAPPPPPAPISVLTHLANPLFNAHFGMPSVPPAPKGSLFGESGSPSNPYAPTPFGLSGQPMTPTLAPTALQDQENPARASRSSPRAPPRHFKSPGSTRTRRPVRILRPLRNPPPSGSFSDPFASSSPLAGDDPLINDHAAGSPTSDLSSDAVDQLSDDPPHSQAVGTLGVGTHSTQDASNGSPDTAPPPPFQFGASHTRSRPMQAPPVQFPLQPGNPPLGGSSQVGVMPVMLSRGPLGGGYELSPLGRSQDSGVGWLPSAVQAPGGARSGTSPGWGGGLAARRVSSGGSNRASPRATSAGNAGFKNKKRSAPALDAPSAPRQVKSSPSFLPSFHWKPTQVVIDIYSEFW